MRALTLWQPWASAIPRGWKQFETRGRLTHVRGQLAIHAAARWGKEQKAFCEGLKRQHEPYPINLPFSAIVAVVDLVDCIPVEDVPYSGLEWTWGNFAPGRYAWQLDNVQELAEPVPCSGSQGFWFTSEAVERQVLEQIDV